MRQLVWAYSPNDELSNKSIIYDTDLEIIFPDFESINFEALTLSGTLELPVADGRRLHIYLYYGDYTCDLSNIDLGDLHL